MERDRRTFVVHVYSTDRCAVQDVRTGESVGASTLAEVGNRIGELLGVVGEPADAGGASDLLAREDAAPEA